MFFVQGANSGSPAILSWGSITGSLPNQLDLAAALALKANIVSSSKTVAQMQALITGVALVPGEFYTVTNADTARASLLVRAATTTTLYRHAVGTFQNAKMLAAVAVVADYVLTASVDKIYSLHEPIRNNYVYCAEYFTALSVFQFDDVAWKNNVFRDVECTNFGGTGTVFTGCTLETVEVNLGNFNNCSFSNHWHKGALNIGASAEIVAVGAGVQFDCTNAWGNDDDTTFGNMAAGSQATYIQMGWTSFINWNSLVNTIRYVTVGNNCEINLLATGGPPGILYRCTFQDGAQVDIGGNLSSTTVGGESATGRIMGGNNLIMGMTTSGGASTPININGSTLQKILVQNRASGAKITNCNLTNCTINYAGKTGCEIIGVSAIGQTYTFSANNQIITATAPGITLITWAALLALSGSYVAGTVYQTTDAPDSSTKITTIKVVAYSTTKLASEGDGLITNPAVIADRPCRITFNWSAAAGAYVTGYSDGLGNDFSGMVSTAMLDAWIGQLTLVNIGINVMESTIIVGGGTLTDCFSIGPSSSITLPAGTISPGKIGRSSSVALTGTQSLQGCEIGDNMVFNGAGGVHTGYTANNKTMRQGFSNFEVSPGDYAAITADGVGGSDFSAVAFAGIVRMTDNTNPVNAILSLTDAFPVMVIADGVTITMNDATVGFGNLHLVGPVTTMPNMSSVTLWNRSGRVEQLQYQIILSS